MLNKAQEAFNVLLVSVVSSSGLLDITRSLQDEGVQDEDRLLCVVDRPVPFNEFSLCLERLKFLEVFRIRIRRYLMQSWSMSPIDYGRKNGRRQFFDIQLVATYSE